MELRGQRTTKVSGRRPEQAHKANGEWCFGCRCYDDDEGVDACEGLTTATWGYKMLLFQIASLEWCTCSTRATLSSRQPFFYSRLPLEAAVINQVAEVNLGSDRCNDPVRFIYMSDINNKKQENNERRGEEKTSTVDWGTPKRLSLM